jgi:hypothetical protein
MGGFKWYYIKSVTDWDLDIFINNICYWNIPNKPLTLYSADEEKSLLELLSNLQNYE